MLPLSVFGIPLLASANGGAGMLFAFIIIYTIYYVGALVIFYFLISLLRKYVHWVLTITISVISVYAGVLLVNTYTDRTINDIEQIFSIAPIVLVPFLILYAIVYFGFTKTSKRFLDFLTSSLFLATLAIGLGMALNYFVVNQALQIAIRKEKCDLALDIESKSQCFHRLSLSPSSEKCASITFSSQRYRCFTKLAEAEKSILRCKELGSDYTAEAEICKAHLAKLLKDPTLCDADIGQESARGRSICYYLLARVKNDKSLCDRIDASASNTDLISYYSLTQDRDTYDRSLNLSAGEYILLNNLCYRSVK